MKKANKKYIFVLCLFIGLMISISSVHAIEAYIESSKVSYDNKYTDKNNVQDSIDELYERSGIHKEKWVDPILNGADPVLKAPLIPVEIKSNGDVYYANINSEWYNYKEKKWANAIILVDNPSNQYKVGDLILEDDIESYFVWIPRYRYRIWTLANSDEFTHIVDTKLLADNELYKITGSARVIDVEFGNTDKVPKMNESGAKLNEYYTHPAFTLGDKNLNGFWVGKFETGYKGATSVESAQVNSEEKDSVIIKPNVYSWRSITIKNIFNTSYNYARELESHMLKNTEWGAVAYLSHSQYGISTEVRINNHSEYKTGYSAAGDVNVNLYPMTTGTSDTITQPWNTPVGYLASTTGNITGVYDMSGGAWEYVASCIDGMKGNSSFTLEEIEQEEKKGYIDKYKAGSLISSFNNRILGDATGEMGPFYQYYDGASSQRNNWYQDHSYFLDSTGGNNWLFRGGDYTYGKHAGQFVFSASSGGVGNNNTFRIVLMPTI